LPLLLRRLIIGIGRFQTLLGQPFCMSRPNRLPRAYGRAEDERERDDAGGCQESLVPAGQLAETVQRGWRARLHRLVIQVALHVGGEAVGRLVAAVAVL